MGLIKSRFAALCGLLSFAGIVLPFPALAKTGPFAPPGPSAHIGDFSVVALAFSPNGKTLASGSADRKVKLWNVATGGLLRTFHGHTGMVTSVCFSPDGKTVASGSEDQTIAIWDIATGVCLRTLRMYLKTWA